MKILNKGDKVAVLDDAIEGEVIQVKGNQIMIQTNEDFLLTYTRDELVIIEEDTSQEWFTNQKISKALSEKAEKSKRSFKKEKKSKKEGFVLEVDLHIEKLVPSSKGLSNFDILNIQMDTAKGQLEFAIRNRMQRMVFIHGVGEGVLKSELEFLLSRYPEISFQEASFQKYGFGATEVFIKQNPNR